MISRLVLSSFRNYDHAELAFNARNVIFTGRNGQGKTNLLEAVFFLSVLRSFRTSVTREMKKIGRTSFYLGAEIEQQQWHELLEVDYGENRRRRLSIDHCPVTRASEFINQIRAVVFSPEDINIVTAHSGFRRRFMDMLISVVEPAYLNALRNYGIALKNRNVLLRTAEPDLSVLTAYEAVMAENCVEIIPARKKYVELLIREVNGILLNLSDGDVFDIRYRMEVDPVSAAVIQNKFFRDRNRDFRRGFTGFGPQADDFELYFGKKPMRSFASTGQCRLISLCLKLAKLNILGGGGSSDLENVIVLADDVTGELDQAKRELFLTMISRAGQTFFTFTDQPGFDFSGGLEYYEIVNGTVKKL
ncbi:MAG: DNA replication and repair protein RecF [Victivallaceae bacterium]|nr:DNA replication and repair protein RecF [Victivallaceae bacterium]